jgi:glycerol-3-phosphate acyltransferase PlsY
MLGLWGAVALVIVYIDPQLLKDILIPGLYLPFYILVLIALWYTISLVTKNILHSLIMSLIFITALMLSMFKLTHVGLIAVILLTLVIESVYIYRHNEKNSKHNELENRESSI